MNRQDRANKTVEVALRNAVNRLVVLNSKDKECVKSEYREWLQNPEINDDIWFSTDYKKKKKG